MFRSRARGLSTSPLLGQKISANGDMLSFGYNTSEIVNAVGSENCSGTPEPCGPTITGVIDNRGAAASPNVLDGHVIQEGAIPQALAPLIQGLLDQCPGKRDPSHSSMWRRLVARLKTLFLGPYVRGSSINRTIPYLIMSHDSGEGIMTLQDDKPFLQLSSVERPERLRRLQDVLAKMTNAVDGKFIDASPKMGVHPLGGARMSADGTGRIGVVDHTGRLFTGLGDGVHEGIVCVDGSVVPRSLGK